MIFFIQGVGFLAVSHAHSYLQFSLALICVGASVGLTTVNTTSWLLESASEQERLKATGLLSSSIFMGQFFSPILMYYPVELLGIEGAFMFVSFILFGWSAFIYFRGRA